MHADLWTDLLNPANRRGHPLLAALLYVFCPASARWWLAGADPVAPFDPLYQAHHLRASGRTLREILEGWGLGDLIVRARKYVEQAEAFRAQPQHRHVAAPELLPTFLGGKLPIAVRHGHAEAFERIGGWRNFYPFVRAWAFSLRDWQMALGWPTLPELGLTTVEAPDSSESPALLSVWKLTGRDRSALGMLVPEPGRPLAWFAERILGLSEAGDALDLYVLSDAGRVERVVPVFGQEVLLGLVRRAATLALSGPHPPINALTDPLRCRQCGFHHLCWAAGSRELTPLAAAF